MKSKRAGQVLPNHNHRPRYLTLFTRIALVAVLVTLVYPGYTPTVSADAGGGGTGTGGSGGHQSSNGYGWYRFRVTDTEGPDRNGNNDFRNGTSWSSVRRRCAPYSDYIYVFIIRGSGGSLANSMGYNDSNGDATAWTRNYITAGDFIGRSNALDRFRYAESVTGDSGLTWHREVGWFCGAENADWEAQPQIRMRVQRDDGSWPSWPSWGSGNANVTAGRQVQWQHQFVVSGMRNPPELQYCAIDNSTTGDIRPLSDCTLPNRWSDNVGVGGNSDDRISTTYTTSAANVGQRVCRQTEVNPRSSSSSGRLASGQLCATIVAGSQPPVVACGATTLPSNSGLGVNLPFTTSVSPGQTANSAMSIRINVDGPGSADRDFGVVSHTASGTGTATVLTTNSRDYTPTAEGTYTLYWRYYVNTTLSLECRRVLQVGRQPFFAVNNGDIYANGSITGHNRNSGAYEGSGTNLAALSTDLLNSFITGRDAMGSPAGRRLAFANAITASGPDVYGGNLAVIVARRASNTNTNGATTLSAANLSAMSSGTYVMPTGGTISGTVASGTDIRIVVPDGDVFINASIGYGSYASIAAIPRLEVSVLNGNVLVGAGVAEIRGTFDVRGGSDITGIFYSCAIDAANPVDFEALSGRVNECNRQLNVYGTISASRLVLTRTYSGWSSTPSAPAEVFHQSPESWLGGSTPRGFDSYVSLPPVL